VMKENYEFFLRTALDAALKAGQIQRERFRRPKEITYKSAIDLVTDVDKKCEEIIVHHLRKNCPTIGILSEEGFSKNFSSPNLWIVDPLDGTTNYAHGYPCFSISIALQLEKELVIGVIHNPLTQESYTATKKGGAFKNNQPLCVSSVKRVERALLCTGFPYDIGISERNNLREFTKVIRYAQGVRRDGSAALDLCRVAEGVFDGFWELKLKPWDVAAGALIIKEAGGMVTTFTGDPFSPFADTIVGTNGLIHEEMLSLLQ